MAARSGGFSDRMDAMKSFVDRMPPNQAMRVDKAGVEELNLLLKGGLQRAEYDKDEDWFGEDGYLKDESDPLEYAAGPQEDLPPPVTYQVLYKRIAIRKGPSTEAKVLGTAEQGDTLLTYGSDASGDWRRVHYRLRGGWGNNVVAWVLVQHPTLGRLLKVWEEEPAQPPQEAVAGQQSPQKAGQQGAPQQGQAQPAQEQQPVPAAKVGALPISAADIEDCARELEEMIKLHSSKAGKKEKRELSELELLKGAKQEDSEAEGDDAPAALPTTSPEGYVYATVDEMDEAADVGLQYQVVHKPFVAMRHLAGPKGKVVNSLEYGSYVDTFGWDPKKKWRKIFCRMPENGRVIVAWMMTSHEELGPLVEPAAG